MMDRDWLALTGEEAIEPGLDIVDAHHHLWDDPSPNYGRYDLDDLLIDTGGGHRITQTVFIDCGANYRAGGPAHLAPVGETEFVAGRADRADGRPGTTIAAIVSHANLLLGPAVEEVLDAHIAAGSGRFRGIRHSGARADDPTVPVSRVEPPAGLYADPGFVAGARTLAAMGLSFEAWQYHTQLGDVLGLARAVPELTVVVNHLGGPLGIGRFAGHWDEVHAATRAGLAELAAAPNVVVKLGGVGMTRYGTGWENRERPPTSDDVAATWGDLIRWTIDTFGPDRCLFESNYPVDGETTGYAVLWNAFKKLTVGYDAADRAALFAGTARRVYRLDPPATNEDP